MNFYLGTEGIIGVVVGVASAVGAIATLIVKLVGIHQTLKIERESKKQEEKENFYYKAATNYVLSAERLNLTGAQKKEYVMTWLENEAIKSKIEVDKPLMSTAIEHVILIMNDHRNLDTPIDEKLEALIKTRIETEKQKKLNELNENVEKANEIIEKTTKGVKKTTEKTSDLIKELEEQ